MYLRPHSYGNILMDRNESPLQLIGMESQYAVLGKRHEADLDPSNLKDTNEESLKYSEIQLPTIHNTYAFGTNDHSNIGEMPDYLDNFLDLGLRSGYTEASLTNAPT